MSQTLLHRLFGIGKIPTDRRPGLEEEGIVLVDEGIGGAIHMRKFRAPGRYYGRKVSLITGSIVLTEKRLVAFTMYPLFNPIIDVEFGDERFGALQFSVKRDGVLRIAFDPAVFHDDRSGSVEVTFKTPRARRYLDRLRQRKAAQS